MEDINNEVWDSYVNEEIAALRQVQQDAEFWKQLDDDLAMYDKNWAPT